jgi:hypothetical protein
MLIPRRIKGVTEEDRIVIPWLELADWTGKDVSLHTSGQMRERMSVHPSGLIKKWLVEEESRQGLMRENESAKLFEECQRKPDRLANLLNTVPALEEADEVESIPGGAVLGAALITWLKETEETVEVAKKVVGTVWPELCGGQSQRHLTRITSCVSKTTLADNVEYWTRKNRARCPQHLTLLRYVCPWCKSRLCTECNEAKEQKECPMCNAACPAIEPGKCIIVQDSSSSANCINLHLLGKKWIEEVTDARKSSRSQKEGENLEFRARIRGWAEKSKRIRCTYLLQKSESRLRAELLEARQKDMLLIPRTWYPEDMPIDSTPGWWYAPAEAIVGSLCKRCNTFCEQAGFTSNEWSMVNKASCRKCQKEERKCTKRNDDKRRKMSAKHRSGKHFLC